MWTTYFAGAAVVLGGVSLLWLYSLSRRDASVVDVFWGLGFAAAAWSWHLAGAPATPRRWLVLALVTLWGARLAGYVAWRNRGRGEDYRYREMRERAGAAFWWRSYFTVFLLQGVLICLIAAPLFFVVVGPPAPGWRWSDAAGLALWLVGFVFEAGGDAQLARFKADPANRGKVLDTGLWSLTRHPNYFGDAAVWWGFYAFALAVPGGVWTAPAPLLMNFLLLKVSGVALLEDTIAERRPGYREYVRKTPPFVPWPWRWPWREWLGRGRGA